MVLNVNAQIGSITKNTNVESKEKNFFSFFLKMIRARFNDYLDGDIAKLIFAHLLHKPSRASARAVCRNWRELMSGPTVWKLGDIVYGLCSYYSIVEHFISHWVFLPAPVKPTYMVNILNHIYVRDHVDALNWLAMRYYASGNSYLPYITTKSLALSTLEGAVRIPRIYQWFLARTRNTLHDRIYVFWMALFVMDPIAFVSFLESASMVDTKYMMPWAGIEQTLLGKLVVSSDSAEYANRVANLKELAKPRWNIHPAFWSKLFRIAIWSGLNGPSENCLLALHLVCEAYGQVPPDFCEFLKTNGHHGTHQTLRDWCVCSNKKGKRK